MPHALRDTLASLPIEAGESLKYVREQPGHHSPTFTLAVYGHLIPRGDCRAVDRLGAAIRTLHATGEPSLASLVSESAQIHVEVSELSL
jgi:hypothetical protein